MNNGKLFTVITMFIVMSIFSRGIAAGQPLRRLLETTWTGYLKACKSGKESELEKTMSSFRLGTMKNNLASAKRSLTPDLIKSLAEHVPDISTTKFYKLLENGPTAGIVYVKDSGEKDASDEPQVTFTFIKFVKENGVWKVDGEMNIGGPKLQKNGKESEFDPSDLPPTHQIDGKVRKPPAQATVPDIAGMLDVSSYGYKTEVTINGVEQAATLNKSHSGMIEKGLRKGKNSIVIRFTKTDPEAVFNPGVTIRIVTDNQRTKEIFKYEPKDAVEGARTLVFTVD